MGRGADNQADDILYGEFAPSGYRLSLHRGAMPKVAIEIWSDDGHRQIHLEDISEYLSALSLKTLKAIEQIDGWHEHYLIVEIISYYSDRIPGVKEILDYGKTRDISFGAEIDVAAAEEWIRRRQLATIGRQTSKL